MNQNDMELQAIREKLQSLQAESPAAEALTLPWSAVSEPDVSVHSAAYHNNPHPVLSDKSTYEGAYSDGSRLDSHDAHAEVENQSPQAIAIETLKQRSRGGEGANARIDNLVAQELYRLEVQANIINEQSQRQAEDILALKRAAQQASVGLRRQGIQNHPQLAIITQFLERYSSASVPHITRDEQGHFMLSYNTLDFQRAQKDALETAHDLRSRAWRTDISKIGQLQDELFSQPLPTGSRNPTKRQAEPYIPQDAYSETDGATKPHRTRKNRLQKSLSNTIDKALYLFGQNRERKRKVTPLSAEITEGLEMSVGIETLEEGYIDSDSAMNPDSNEAGSDDTSNREISAQFSLLDGTIWFSGAAIARIIIQTIALTYPVVQTLFVTALAALISLALYKVLIARSNNYSLIYRLCIAMAGLLMASLFR